MTNLADGKRIARRTPPPSNGGEKRNSVGTYSAGTLRAHQPLGTLAHADNEIADEQHTTLWAMRWLMPRSIPTQGE